MTQSLTAWNDTPTRQAILDFVARVTDPDSAGYVPPEERIATFDNDGTLWCEQPFVQGDFILQRLAAMAETDASLRQTQPWQATYEKDTSWVSEAMTQHYNGDDSDLDLNASPASLTKPTTTPVYLQKFFTFVGYNEQHRVFSWVCGGLMLWE